MTKTQVRRQFGFSLIELMVSLTIFSVVSMAVTGYIIDTMRRVGLEARASLASQELNNAFDLMQSEIRMAGAVSPYNVGTDPTIVTCGAQLAVTPNTVRFLITHDSSTGTSGMQIYYVGYQFDSATNTLYRGEVTGVSTTACTLPATDPLSAGTRQILARNVIAIDADNDGTIDPVFSFTSPRLQVNLGVQVTGQSGLTITQKVSDAIVSRAL